MIGCEDGLSVTVSDAPAGSWTLEVEESDGTVHRQSCDSDTGCNGAFFPGVRSDLVTVRVLTDDEPREWSINPTYERFQPNGRGCPPVCTQARVEIAL